MRPVTQDGNGVTCTHWQNRVIGMAERRFWMTTYLCLSRRSLRAAAALE